MERTVWGMAVRRPRRKKPGSVTQLPRSPPGGPLALTQDGRTMQTRAWGLKPDFLDSFPRFAVYLPLTLGSFSHLQDGIKGGWGCSCEIRGVNLQEVFSAGLSVSCPFIHKT